MTAHSHICSSGTWECGPLTNGHRNSMFDRPNMHNKQNWIVTNDLIWSGMEPNHGNNATHKNHFTSGAIITFVLIQHKIQATTVKTATTKTANVTAAPRNKVGRVQNAELKKKKQKKRKRARAMYVSTIAKIILWLFFIVEKKFQQLWSKKAFLLSNQAFCVFPPLLLSTFIDSLMWNPHTETTHTCVWCSNSIAEEGGWRCWQSFVNVQKYI